MRVITEDGRRALLMLDFRPHFLDPILVASVRQDTLSAFL